MAFKKILIVGFGAMTGAMVEGWLAAGHSATEFEIYHPRRQDFAHELKVHNLWPQDHFDAVLVGVKPQKLDEITAGLEPLLGPDTVLVSVLAGKTLDNLQRNFPRAGGWVRFMPNLAVAIRKSPNALIHRKLDADARTAVTQLALDLGTAEWIEDEGQFDLVTALAGSGPGFVYRFIDALAQGASELGLPDAQALRLAIAMVEGASVLAASSDLSPAELAERVASPGGMTRKGLDVLDRNDALKALLRECLRAARDRGAELAGGTPR